MPAQSLHPGSPPIMYATNQDLRHQRRFFRLTWICVGCSMNNRDPSSVLATYVSFTVAKQMTGMIPEHTLRVVGTQFPSILSRDVLFHAKWCSPT